MVDLNGELLSSSDVAEMIGLRPWRLNRMHSRGLLQEPPRVSRFRVYRPADVPAIREAAIKAGYLQPAEGDAMRM